MPKESKKSAQICKNEHDTLLAIKVSLLTQVSGDSGFSNRVFWIFDNLPRMHPDNFKTRKCEKCKGDACEAFKQLKDVKKKVADPKSVEQGMSLLMDLYQIPSMPDVD